MMFGFGPLGALRPGIVLRKALGIEEARAQRLAPRFVIDDPRLDLIDPDALDPWRGALQITGFLAVKAGNGLAVETATKGILVAGCGTGPKNIKDSIGEARSAADAALAQINPILLDGEPADSEGKATAPPDDDVRAQIEKLLYALIDRP